MLCRWVLGYITPRFVCNVFQLFNYTTVHRKIMLLTIIILNSNIILKRHKNWHIYQMAHGCLQEKLLFTPAHRIRSSHECNLGLNLILYICLKMLFYLTQFQFSCILSLIYIQTSTHVQKVLYNLIYAEDMPKTNSPCWSIG